MVFDPKINRNNKDALGSPGDDRATDSTSAWTMIALLKGIYNLFSGGITVNPPVGGATAAKQDTGNTSLASIDGKLTSGVVVSTHAVTQSGAWTARLQDGTGTAITSVARGSERALTVQIVDGSGAQVTSFGGAGGTSSNFGSAFPAPGTAVGFSDGTNMVGARVTSGALADNETPPTSGILKSQGFNYVFDGAAWDRWTGAVSATLAAETTKVIGTVNISAAQTVATVTTVGALTAITNALPAGTNAIGTFSRTLKTTKVLTNANVSISTSGENVIVAGTAAQTVRVFRIVLVAAAPVELNIKDAASGTTLALIPLGTNGSFTWESDIDEPLWVTAVAGAFVISLSAAIAVKGFVQYTKS